MQEYLYYVRWFAADGKLVEHTGVIHDSPRMRYSQTLQFAMESKPDLPDVPLTELIDGPFPLTTP